MDLIFETILTNNYINSYFKDIALSNHQLDINEFKQHIYLIIAERIKNKATRNEMYKLYNRNELGKYVMGIIKKQLGKNSSFFYKKVMERNTLTSDYISEDIADNTTTTSFNDIIIDKVVSQLNHIPPEDAILFKLYYGINTITNDLKEPMTYKQIQQLTGHNYLAVRNSVMKTLAVIRETKFT